MNLTTNTGTSNTYTLDVRQTNAPTVERRISTEVWPLADLDIRSEGNGLNFRGYAAVFDADSEPLPFIETIRAGAFKKTLTSRNQKLFLNHNSDIVLGSTKSGTLTLKEDSRGLVAEANLPDNHFGHYTRDAIKRGDVDSMSFGFSTVRDKWSEDGNRRELTEVRLFEVSIVTGFPAYTATSASVRGLPDDLSEALRAFMGTGQLTDEQAALLSTAIDARRIKPSRLDYWRAQFAS